MVLASESNHVAERDGHVSRHLPGSSAGPNKANHAPTGAGTLASELSAQADAQRELARARAEGDDIPVASSGKTGTALSSSNAGELGIGLPNGAQQGVREPEDAERATIQRERDEAFRNIGHSLHSTDGETTTLADLARMSKASGASHPTSSTAGGTTASTRADILIDQVGRSIGTESGTGAAGGDEVEIGRDAPTSNAAPVK